ncbi:hypothetical protein [Gordonia malaquae]|nr:hypothetical protein [Gordonia malaquae]SEC15748.1 hypothetical protein SAMN04488550_1403 [Gordonia malaquae]
MTTRNGSKPNNPMRGIWTSLAAMAVITGLLVANILYGSAVWIVGILAVTIAIQCVSVSLRYVYIKRHQSDPATQIP